MIFVGIDRFPTRTRILHAMPEEIKALGCSGIDQTLV